MALNTPGHGELIHAWGRVFDVLPVCKASANCNPSLAAISLSSTCEKWDSQNLLHRRGVKVMPFPMTRTPAAARRG